jgi:hypothetical protein
VKPQVVLSGRSLARRRHTVYTGIVTAKAYLASRIIYTACGAYQVLKYCSQTEFVDRLGWGASAPHLRQGRERDAQPTETQHHTRRGVCVIELALGGLYSTLPLVAVLPA